MARMPPVLSGAFARVLKFGPICKRGRCTRPVITLSNVVIVRYLFYKILMYREKIRFNPNDKVPHFDG